MMAKGDGRLYKVLRDGESCDGGSLVWSLPTEDGKPGEWHEVTGNIVPCSNGLHLTPNPKAWWDRYGGYRDVYVAEGEDIVPVQDDKAKVVARRARLLRRLTAHEMVELELIEPWTAGRIRATSKPRTAKAKDDGGPSPAFTLVRHVWQHNCKAVVHSWSTVNSAMRASMSLAIDGGLKFADGDVKKIHETMRGGYWFGDGGESIYAQAVKSGNVSACRSFEAWRGRPPLTIDGKRIAMGSTFIWEGQHVRVTSFRPDGLFACSYKDFDGKPAIGWSAIDKRHWITFEEFIAAERARLTSIGILKTSEKIAALLNRTDLKIDVALVAFWNDEQRDEAGAWASIAMLDVGKNRVKPPQAPRHVVDGAAAGQEARDAARVALTLWQRNNYSGVPSDYVTEATKPAARLRKGLKKP